MFYIVIGQSGAGKTSFCKNNWLIEPYQRKEHIIPYTVCANGVHALGKYGIGKRTEGTDTLSYNAKAKIKAQLKVFAEQGRDVLLEGDRINNRETMEYIASLRVPVKMYLITCSLSTSMRRLRAAGSKISVKFVKTTKTKSKNIFLEYGGRFNGEIIKTD